MSLAVPLAVRLKTSRRDVHVTRDCRDVSWRHAIPGGFASARIALDRPLRFDPDEIALYGSLYIYDARSGATLFQGRLEDPGRGGSADGEVWELTAVGPAAHARDRTVARVYVERSWEHWIRNFQADKAGVTDTDIDSDDDSSPLARAQCPRGVVAGTSFRAGYQYNGLYESGQKLARFNYAWNGGVTDADWRVRAGTSATPTGTQTLARNDALDTAGSVSGARVVVTDFPNGDKVLHLVLRRITSSQTPANDGTWVQWKTMYILALRKDKAGTEITSYTTNTVLASQVVEDLLGDLLTSFDGATARVDATMFAIEQLAYRDGATPADILEDLMRLEPDFWWAAWEDTVVGGKSRFEWRSWPTTVGYDVFSYDEFSSPGSAAELWNAVTVRFRDKNGRLRIVTRTQTVKALTDAGLTRTGFLDLGDDVSDKANAERAGDKFLAEHATPPNAGTLVVRRAIYDRERGRMVEPWELRPGGLVRVNQVMPRAAALAPTERDGSTVFRVTALDYAASDNAATLELDAAPLRIGAPAAPKSGLAPGGLVRRR